MCVGIAATILKMERASAMIDMHGARRKISVELLDGVKEGDQVMVHAGVAIAKILPEEPGALPKEPGALPKESETLPRKTGLSPEKTS